MRKGVVIAGAIVLVISVAIFGVGLYLLVDQSGLTALGVNAQKTAAVLPPGGSVTIASTSAGDVTIVAYSDNVSAPLQVSSGGSPLAARTSSANGVTDYVAVFTGVGTNSGSSPVVIQNNQTRTVSVQYAAVQTGIGALAYGGLAVLGGGLLFVIGLVVLIVGLVLKKRPPPGEAPAPSS